MDQTCRQLKTATDVSVHVYMYTRVDFNELKLCLNQGSNWSWLISWITVCAAGNAVTVLIIVLLIMTQTHERWTRMLYILGTNFFFKATDWQVNYDKWKWKLSAYPVLFFGASMSRSVGERFFFKFVLKKVNVDYESLV